MPIVGDIVEVAVIASVGWVICWYICRRVSRLGVQLRHRRTAVIATAGAVATAALHIWAMRGLRGHPYEWLADPVTAAIVLPPLIYTLCAVQAGLSSGAVLEESAAARPSRLQRSHGFLWRRTVEQRPAIKGE